MSKGTYKRYTTRLRFEPGQAIPEAGASWVARTELGGVLVTVRLLEVKKVFEHPNEPGVTLMDARISRSNVFRGIGA